MRGVAEPDRDLALDIEGKPLLGAPGDEMHVAADRPQEVAAAAEAAVFARIVDAELDQLLAFAYPVDVLGNPVERVQVAQAALAVLDVGLDQIARLAGAAMALLALGELGGDEFAAVPARPPCRSAPSSSSKSCVAEQEARLEDRGADGHVGLRWRMHSFTERVACPTLRPMSHRQ
jgi:hypothetical protein